MNSNFQTFTQQFEPVNANEFDECNDNPNDVNILADIEHIASGDSSGIAPDVYNLNEHDVDDVLQYASQLDLDDEVKGPKINEKIASIVKKITITKNHSGAIKSNYEAAQ